MSVPTASSGLLLLTLRLLLLLRLMLQPRSRISLWHVPILQLVRDDGDGERIAVVLSGDGTAVRRTIQMTLALWANSGHCMDASVCGTCSICLLLYYVYNHGEQTVRSIHIRETLLLLVFEGES